MSTEKEKPEKSVRIVRHGTERDFTILRNDAVRDGRLSWKATGLLVYVISLPDDWRLYLSDLAKRKKDGRDSTRAGLAELELAGYLSIEQVRVGGRFVETVWHVSDVPAAAEKPYSGFPNTVNPNSENPTLQRTQPQKHIHEEPTPKERESVGPTAPRRRAKGPLSGGGGASRASYTTDPQTKISLQVGNSADETALAEIRQHHPDAIAQAVARAAAGELSGRAYPTAVLRRLRRADEDAPAWARAGRAPAEPRAHEIDITAEGETL